jgi:SAM-dependent methyltransferase
MAQEARICEPHMGRPRQESLDEIVSRSAVTIADQIRQAAGCAKSEMDLQVEVAAALKGFARDAKITLEGHHNATIATGRPDSVYGSVIVEYKDPGSLSGSKDAAPNRSVVEQLKRRFYDMRREERRNWNSMFGVGTDGKYFIFFRFRDDKWTDQEPLEVNRHSTERFLWALYNLGQKGKPYQPEYLHRDFGSESPVAQDGVRALYEDIRATDNPKAQVFFNQWKILFGEVCGYDVENLSDKLRKLAEFYVVKGKPQPAQLLFALHTYYAILIKLLAAEIVSFFNPWMPREVEKLQSATTPAKLKRELEELERGGIFHQMGITNFLEGDLFSWYLAVWSEPIQTLVRKMITKLDQYNPGTFSEEPAQSRDLLKKLYQQLFPKSVRHDLGEYYTPDWLAEHVLNELGYQGDPDKRLLDPACGSGTFLVMAINRIRRWYDQNREKCAYDEADLLRKILANVIGFDLNPLAVMAARTNYLVAIRDLIRHVESVEIPVYLCDSIMTPAEYGDLFTGASLGNVAKVPCSAMKPPHLLVPKEIAKSPKEVAKYADVLENCVRNGYAPEEFLSRCRDEGLNITATDAHLDLYKELVKLDKANKNGIWARIIKNNFAPLFVGRVDYVAGNPPWVRWGYLPPEYRSETAHLWRDYGLFTKKGIESRMGTAELDLSMLFTYVSADAYLQLTHSRLGFVITKEVFKNKGAAEGFRLFRVPARKLVFRPYRVDDLASLRPFHAANKTACLFLEKSVPPRYPVPYYVWSKAASAPTPETEMTVEEARAYLITAKRIARPIGEDGSAWQTMMPVEEATLKKLAGASTYKARIGARVEPYGVYWVEIVSASNQRKPLVANLPELGKTPIDKIAPRAVEPDFLYPALRGRDIKRWGFNQKVWVLVLNKSTKREDWIEETAMRRKWPMTLEYLSTFTEVLLSRANYWKFFGHPIESSHEIKEAPPGQHLRLRSSSADAYHYEISEAPFYMMFNIGPYTFAPFRVCWSRMANTIRATVISDIETQIGRKQVIPTDTATIVPFDKKDEAHFFCSAANSSPFRWFVHSFSSAGRGFGSAGILERVQVPPFNSSDKLHVELSSLSQACHTAVAKEDLKIVESLEGKIDKAAAKLWGITDDELKAIQDALAQTKKSKRRAKDEDEDE